MILLGGAELPLRAVREQVATSIDVLVHLTRDDHGRRFVSTISEVEGMEGEVISLAELFRRPAGPLGIESPLEPTALVPRRLLVRSGGGIS
jgi:Flp pilus assembly CpaF family ATPase